MGRGKVLLLILPFLSLSLGHLHSQELRHVWDGELPRDQFGSAVASAGDVDGDGFDDVLIGAWGQDSGGGEAGRAYVYDGLGGSLLYTFTGEAPGDRFGAAVAGVGDVDNDGHDDVAVGAWSRDGAGPDSGSVYVFSGDTGSLLYRLDGAASGDAFGYALCGAGDIDFDGCDDVVVGAWRHDGGGIDAGRVSLFSGRTGLLIGFLEGEAAGDGFGASVASADVDNDGLSDLIVGALLNDEGGLDAGKAYIFSSATAQLVHAFVGKSAGDYFGWSVGNAGRIDGDDHEDVLIGAPYREAFAGEVVLVSGADGSTIHEFSGESAGDQLGVAVDGGGDFDGDGQDDILLGAWESSASSSHSGRVYVLDGGSFEELIHYDGEAALDRLGVSLAFVGRTDSDSSDDILLGAVFHDGNGSDAGRAYLRAGSRPPEVDSLTPSRGPFDDTTTVIVSGEHFQLASDTEVWIGDQQAQNVTVINDETILCDAPPGARGPVTVRVLNNFGEGSLDEGYFYTPAVAIEGESTLGSEVTLRYLCNNGDGIFAIFGFPPEVDIPIGGFEGSLRVFPFKLLFSIVGWPFDELSSVGTIPKDPALSGVEVLFQGLIGPDFGLGQATWTNVSRLLIE